MPFVAPRDKIRFEFKLTPGNLRVEFPAYLQDLSTQVSPSWTGYNEIGRADNKYIYETFSKTVNISFTVVAETRQGEMSTSTVFDKLEILSKAAVPHYQIRAGRNGIPTLGTGFVGHFIVFTVGEIYVNEVGYLTSLTYDWDNSTTTWDLDEQLPMITNVSLNITWTGRTMARGTTSFFSLSKATVPARQLLPPFVPPRLR